MCGIAGLIDFRGTPGDGIVPVAKRMTERLFHRGPDDWGLVHLAGDGTVETFKADAQKKSVRFRGHQNVSLVLGHARLSIIDLSARGHQPMASEDGRFWITFNGEIYNYRELRADLEAKGCRFLSSSDTEVLLKLYAAEGPDAVRKLRGMFAFAVWDEKNASLFMARDRFGMKPLYYTQPMAGRFAFASEEKVLFSGGFLKAQANMPMTNVFLQRGHIPAPETYFRDCYALPAGRWMLFDRNGVTSQRYWSLENVFRDAPEKKRPLSEVAQRIQSALADSVLAHQVSDVPVGVFLSGGLDSAALVASLRRSYGGPLKSFTLVFPENPVDESGLAREIVRRYGLDAVEREVSERDFYDGLPDFFASMDQPTVDGLNTYFVARLGRESGLKVALSGLGGDEILGGYGSFTGIPRLKELKQWLQFVPGGGALAVFAASMLNDSRAEKLKEALKDPGLSIPKIWQRYRCLWTPEQARQLGFEPRPAWREEDLENTLPGADFYQIALLETREFMIPQLLRDADIFTMRFALELRTPFVDHVFLEEVVKAGPWERGGAPSYKSALFRALGDFLPSMQLKQPKKGFVLPFQGWLKKALLTATHPQALDMRKRLNQPRFEPWTRAFLSGKLHWSRLWSLYVLSRFEDGV